MNWQLNQAIKLAKDIRLTVCNSDGICNVFKITKKDALKAYEDERFYSIDYLNKQSDGTQFKFVHNECFILDIYIG